MKKQKPMSFDDLLKDLQDQKTVNEDPNHISLDMLFNEAFMVKYSSFKSFEEFMENGNFQVTTMEDVDNIYDELLDRHVARVTEFPDWRAMLDKANLEYAGKS